MTKKELVNGIKEERSNLIESIENLSNVLDTNKDYLDDLIENLDKGPDLDDIDISIEDLSNVIEDIKDAEIEVIDICKTVEEELNSTYDVSIGDLEDEIMEREKED
jgi:hypothetical protein